MFKTRKIIFFVIAMIIISLTSIGLSCYAYFYVGNKAEYKNDDYLFKNEMTIGTTFNVSDIKNDKSYKSLWIDGDVQVNVYVNFKIDDENKLIISDSVIQYDYENKKFNTVGIGSGEIEFVSKVDKTISVRFPYESNFKNSDTRELLETNYSNFFDDDVITKNELEIITKIVISKTKNYNLEEFNLLKNLKSIYITENNNVLNISSKPNCNYYVQNELYTNYINDIGWNNFHNKLFPIVSLDENLVTVLFMFNEGKCEGLENNSSYSVNNEAGSKCEEVTLLKLTRQGYTFDGWYIYRDNTYTDIKVGQDYLFVENTKLYAKWNENHYTVKYNSEKDSANVPAPSTFGYTDEGRITSDVLHYSGYTFIGWSLQIEAVNVDFESDVNIQSLSEIDGDVINLYAVWVPNEYTIVFDVATNGGTGSCPSINNVKYNEEVAIPNYSPTRTGYIFAGWDTDSKTANPIYQSSSMVKNLISDDEGVATLYAIFAGNNYTIEFDANGGTGKPNDMECKYGNEYNIPSIKPSKEYYVFLGWSLNQGATTPSYVAGQKIKNLTTSGTIKLYAVYKYDTFIIRYVGENATNIPADSEKISYNSDSFQINKMVEPKRTGYTFNGWSISQNSSASVDFTKGQTLNQSQINSLYELRDDDNVVRLYAVFTIKKYVFKWVLGDDKSENKGGTVKVTKEVLESNGNKISVNTDLAKNHEYYFNYGTVLEIKVTYGTEKNMWYQLYSDGTLLYDNQNNYQNKPFKLSLNSNYELRISSWDGCIINGTKLTLADGTKKNVEDIDINDQLLVFNHETGKVEVAPGYIIVRDDYEVCDRKVLIMNLSDNSSITIVDEHRFFDTTINKYVAINYENVDSYINHKLLKIKYDGIDAVFEEVTFIGYEYDIQNVEIYSPVAFKYINLIADDLLTAPGGNLEGLFNYFEIGKGYKYDSNKMQEDILNYGLFEYEEFYNQLPSEIKEFMTEELFEFFNGRYFKIVVGKNIMSFEEILKMIVEYCEQLKEI